MEQTWFLLILEESGRSVTGLDRLGDIEGILSVKYQKVIFMLRFFLVCLPFFKRKWSWMLHGQDSNRDVDWFVWHQSNRFQAPRLKFLSKTCRSIITQFLCRFYNCHIQVWLVCFRGLFTGCSISKEKVLSFNRNHLTSKICLKMTCLRLHKTVATRISSNAVSG